MATLFRRLPTSITGQVNPPEPGPLERVTNYVGDAVNNFVDSSRLRPVVTKMQGDWQETVRQNQAAEEARQQAADRAISEATGGKVNEFRKPIWYPPDHPDSKKLFEAANAYAISLGYKSWSEVLTDQQQGVLRKIQAEQLIPRTISAGVNVGREIAKDPVGFVSKNIENIGNFLGVPKTAALQVNGQVLVPRSIKTEDWVGAVVAETKYRKQVLLKSGVDETGVSQYWYERLDGSRVDLKAKTVGAAKDEVRLAIAQSGKAGSATMADLEAKYDSELQDPFKLVPLVINGATQGDKFLNAASSIGSRIQAMTGHLLPLPYDPKVELPKINGTLSQARMYVNTLHSARGGLVDWNLSNGDDLYEEQGHKKLDAIADDVRLGRISAARAKELIAKVTNQLEETHGQQVKNIRAGTDRVVAVAQVADDWSNKAAAVLAARLTKSKNPLGLYAAAAGSASLQSFKAILARNFTAVVNPEALPHAENFTQEKIMAGYWEALSNGFLGPIFGPVKPTALLEKLTALPGEIGKALNNPGVSIPAAVSTINLIKNSAAKQGIQFGKSTLKIAGWGGAVGSIPYTVLGLRQVIPEIRNSSSPIVDTKKELRELYEDPDGYLNANYSWLKPLRPLDGQIRHNLSPGPGEYEYSWRLPTDLYRAIVEERKAQSLPYTGVLAVRVLIDGKPQTVAIFPHWRDEGSFGTSSGDSSWRSDSGYLTNYRIGPPDQSSVKLSTLTVPGGYLPTPRQYLGRIGLDPVTFRIKNLEYRNQQSDIYGATSLAVQLDADPSNRLQTVTGKKESTGISLMSVALYNGQGLRTRQTFGTTSKSPPEVYGQFRAVPFSETGWTFKPLSFTTTDEKTGTNNTVSVNGDMKIQSDMPDIRYQINRNEAMLDSKQFLNP